MRKGKEKGIRIWLILLLSWPLVGLVRPGFSAPPERGEVQSLAFFSRHHWYEDLNGREQLTYNGIWILDPVAGEKTKFRTIFFTMSGPSNQTYFTGNDGNLAFEHDTLTYQSWPNSLSFDALSGRMLGRRPLLTGDLGAGWLIQGPVLTEEMSQDSGLAPGVYGTPRCVREELFDNEPLHIVYPCEAISFPNWGLGITESDPHLLFLDPSSSGSLANSDFVLNFSSEHFLKDVMVLSYDPGRKGFWHGDDSGATFFPAIDGEIGPNTNHIEFSFPPFDEPDHALETLFFHPNSDLLIGYANSNGYTSTPNENYVFTVDAESGVSTMIEESEDNVRYGMPVSFSSLPDEPDHQKQLIPIVASANGFNHTHWKTDIWFYNPSSSWIDVELETLKEPISVRSIQLAPKGSKKVEDVLSFMGVGGADGGPWHDALIVTAPYKWAEQLAVAGRIYTRDPTTGEAFGHAVQAVPFPFGYSNHAEFLGLEGGPVYGALSLSTLDAHFLLDYREPGRFRHNFGITNVSEDPVQIALDWGFSPARRDVYGLFPPETHLEITVPAKSVYIGNFESLFPQEITSAFPPRVAVTGEKPVALWFSMVDNITGDATFVPFSSYQYPSMSAAEILHGRSFEDYTLFLPVVAHTPGSMNSQWRTDAYGFFEQPRITRWIPAGRFWARDGSDCVWESQDGLPIEFIGIFGGAGDLWASAFSQILGEDISESQATYKWETIVPDIVRQVPGCEQAERALGAIEIVTSSWFSGFSRTYSVRPDGGTYGSMLPLFPPNGWPTQHFAGIEASETSRVNIGLFNGEGELETSYRIQLFAEDGSEVASRTVTLSPRGAMQQEIGTFFDGVELASGTYGLTVLPLDEELPDGTVLHQGRSWAYVSVVDNQTNDPINLW